MYVSVHTCLDCLDAAAADQSREQVLLCTPYDGIQAHPLVLQNGVKNPQAGLLR